MSETSFKLPGRFYTSPISVAVAGCGGTGSQIVSGLARLDTCLRSVDHPGLAVTVYDPDRVSEANVGRQLFAPADVGQYKGDVLIHRLNLWYGLDWESVPARYAAKNTFGRPSHDLLIGCVDSSRARRDIGTVARDQNIPYWLDIGNEDTWGQVILGQPTAPQNTARLPTILDMFPEIETRDDPDAGPSCSLAESLAQQSAFINQAVGTVALDALWRIVRTGEITRFAWFVNLQNGRMTSLKADAETVARYTEPDAVAA